MLKITDKVIRIGRQSKSALLEGYTMHLVKDNVQQDEDIYDETAYLYHKYRMSSLKKRMEEVIAGLRMGSKSLKGFDAGLVQQYRDMIDEYEHLRAQAEEALCRNVDVIGLTTSGAARRRKLLGILRPKIVIVEEAAQVLEAHIVASIPASCEHLIMIGNPHCPFSLSALRIFNFSFVSRRPQTAPARSQSARHEPKVRPGCVAL